MAHSDPELEEEVRELASAERTEPTGHQRGNKGEVLKKRSRTNGRKIKEQAPASAMAARGSDSSSSTRECAFLSISIV